MTCSCQQIFDGGMATKDSSESFKYVFDYTDECTLADTVELASVGTFTITGTPPVTISNAQLVNGNRAVEFFVTGGSFGKTYTIEHTVQTNENPPQTFSPWFKLRIT